jgi:DNA mismatch endonuclease, patch repair protein
MVDVHSRAIRSKNMSAIKGKNTSPELAVRKALFARGFRYRLHAAGLPSKPDIVLPKYKTVVFVNGCFWHRHEGCKYAAKPKNNSDFWEKKLARNVERDKQNHAKLRLMGWNIIIVWECELEKEDWEERLVSKIVGGQ